MIQKKTKTAVLLRLMMVTAFLLAAFPLSVDTYAAPVAPSKVTASVPAAPPAAGPQTNQVRIKLVSARDEANWPGDGTAAHPAAAIHKGDKITTNYKYIINLDNVGETEKTRAQSPECDRNTNPNYPDGCNWVSVKAMRASAPIITQGDNLDLNELSGFNLPNGKYLISVIADGFKIDGLHFTLPRPDTGPLVVEMQPYPLPLATVRIQVFEDNAITNGAYDVPGEAPLVGFEGHISDILGPVTTDWYGNPLCTVYQTQNGKGQFDAGGNPTNDPLVLDANGKPVIQTAGGRCLSRADGQIIIPNLGPNRYTGTVIPPDGSNWVQTTTLEGNHDYDIWVQEGATGYDTEFTNPTAEAAAPTIFGFVKPTALAGNPTTPITSNTSVAGGIKGRVWAIKAYIPLAGGLPYTSGGGSGTKLDKPINKPWISLNDLQDGDRAVWVGRGNPDGTFQIDHVKDGDYSISWWDEEQDYILDLRNVTVSGGKVTDLGNLYLAGWWADFKGRVCIDTNNNGKCESIEPGLKNQVVALKTRANSVMERGSTTVVTDSNGYYDLAEAYPLTSWIVMEVFNQRYYTTGVTFQADNQDTPTTVLGNGVDVSVLPIIGLGGTLDWAVRPYAPGTNGGIVGTVTYDSTRNELDPRFAATEVYQPGIPGLTVNLYAPVACGTHPGVSCDAAQAYELDTDGSYRKGPKLNTYTSEEWQRPTGCVARDVNNKALDAVKFDLPVADPTDSGFDDRECIEAPMMGIQFQKGFSTVDGNYGFTTILKDPVTGADIPETAMPAGDYLVQVDIPNDPRTGKPFYQVTREEDVNVFNGDQFTTQEPPPPCAGALHTVHVTNPAFLAIGGSPYEGQQRPLCDMKLISVKNGRSIAPNFNFFTETPLPSRFNGLIVDDLTLSTNPKETLFGEKRGLPNSPIGVYDFNNRLVTTIQSDPNGLFELLMPSTSTYNCPLPAGPCPNVMRLVGNDPGQPGHLNPNYDPQYRTISASFELWPGLIIPADLAPTRIGAVTTQGNGSLISTPSLCRLASDVPQLFAVSKPYNTTDDTGPTYTINRTFTIYGQGFGAQGPKSKVTLTNQDTTATDTTPQPTIVRWTDTEITVTTASNTPSGAYQLNVVRDNGQKTVNGLTYHVINMGGDYNPRVFIVGTPGIPNPTTPNVTYPDPVAQNRNYFSKYNTIQQAIEAASRVSRALVVVYPGKQDTFNPFGVYYENLIIHSPIKLQGVGPGGARADGSQVRGTIIDGLGFQQVNQPAWNQLVSSLTWSGNQQVYEGAVITIFARAGQFGSSYKAAIDGLTIQGGDQLGQPNKVNSAPGGGVVITQGGGIFANAYANNLQITNNLIQSNGGSYGGAIRLGTPYVGVLANNNQNVHIANNRIIANGSTNLAGSIGVFSGSNNYEIDHNDICGNYSAEYGGGISHYGLSLNGKIHDNRIYFNESFDEGGGIFIAGELPANPANLSTGAGPVDVYNNLIQSNLANDDGGGIRFLMAGNFAYNIYNNMIVNNVSTHEGGGIALDDAPNVRIFDNTIMKNITTATAATSNGLPAPAGVSTAGNSQQLQNTLASAAPKFSKPLLFNNIFWDNRAGTFTANGVIGAGLQGDQTPIHNWDVGVADGSGLLDVTNSILQSFEGTTTATQQAAAKNKQVDPQVVSAIDSAVTVLPWRTNPSFIGSAIVALDVPISQQGDYHLKSTSPAIGAGVSSASYSVSIPILRTLNNVTVNAPATDFDGDARSVIYDAGADQVTISSLLDNFNRANSQSGFGTGVTTWSGATGSFQISSNQLQMRTNGTFQAYWNTTSYGANQGAFVTLANNPGNGKSAGLLLKASVTGNTINSGILVNYNFGTNNSNGTITIQTKNGATINTVVTANNVAYSNNAVLAAQALANGTVNVYLNGTLVATASGVTVNQSGGYIGLNATYTNGNGVQFDNFSVIVTP
jgi:hypothetical protein